MAILLVFFFKFAICSFNNSGQTSKGRCSLTSVLLASLGVVPGATVADGKGGGGGGLGTVGFPVPQLLLFTAAGGTWGSPHDCERFAGIVHPEKYSCSGLRSSQCW